jgi:hypothetical protein
MLNPPLLALRQRQQQTHGRAFARRRGQFDTASRLFHERLAKEQADTASLPGGLGRKRFLERTRHDLWRHAVPRIGDVQPDYTVLDGRLDLDACAPVRDHVLHGIRSVDQQVHEDLRDVIRHGGDGGHTVIQLVFELDAQEPLVEGDEVAGRLHERVEVEQFWLR